MISTRGPGKRQNRREGRNPHYCTKWASYGSRASGGRLRQPTLHEIKPKKTRGWGEHFAQKCGKKTGPDATVANNYLTEKNGRRAESREKKTISRKGDRSQERIKPGGRDKRVGDGTQLGTFGAGGGRGRTYAIRSSLNTYITKVWGSKKGKGPRGTPDQ